MISRLYISHYRSISEVDLTLSQVNVLVGKNGSGKSNIVDALSFLSDICNEDLDYAIVKRHGIDSIRQWNKFKPYHITIELNIERDEGKGRYKLVLASSRSNYRIVEESISWDGELTYEAKRCETHISRDEAGGFHIETTYDEDDVDLDDVRSNRLASNVSVLSRVGRPFYQLNWLVGYIVREIQSLSAFSIFPNTIRAPQSVSRAAALEEDGKNIASILKSLPTDAKRRLVKYLQVVMPQLRSITVKSAAGYYVPVFLISEPASGQDHELNMSQISDGTLRILGILAAFNQVAAPSKIVLEEPEQMIHPALLIVIRDAVIDFVSRRESSQVFLTTHSAVLMDLFDVSSVIAVEFSVGSTKAGPVSDRQKKIVRSGLMTLGDVVLAEDLEIA